MNWENRDRFILSGGHGSSLLYALLHMFGCGLTKEGFDEFPPAGFPDPRTPGYGHTAGVEATTGPLGAGMSMAVGMAIAEAHLAAVFNKENYPVVDHYTYVLGGDGCMMEGISSEAFSLAGTLGLSSSSCSTIPTRFPSRVPRISPSRRTWSSAWMPLASDPDRGGRQRLIRHWEGHRGRQSGQGASLLHHRKAQIGYGCPAKQGKASAHGEPLGAENVTAPAPHPPWDGTATRPSKCRRRFTPTTASWQPAARTPRLMEKLFADYCAAYPEMKALWDQHFNGDAAESLAADEEYWAFEDKPQATATCPACC